MLVVPQFTILRRAEAAGVLAAGCWAATSQYSVQFTLQLVLALALSQSAPRSAVSSRFRSAAAACVSCFSTCCDPSASVGRQSYGLWCDSCIPRITCSLFCSFFFLPFRMPAALCFIIAIAFLIQWHTQYTPDANCKIKICTTNVLQGSVLACALINLI